MDKKTSKKRNFKKHDKFDKTDQTDTVIPKQDSKKKDIMTKQKNKRLQKFKGEWEVEYGNWLCEDRNNDYNALCKLCKITFSVASEGKGNILQHYQTEEHQSKLEVTRTAGNFEPPPATWLVLRQGLRPDIFT